MKYLKHMYKQDTVKVAPLVGAWIEIKKLEGNKKVAPLVGALMETIKDL